MDRGTVAAWTVSEGKVRSLLATMPLSTLPSQSSVYTLLSVVSLTVKFTGGGITCNRVDQSNELLVDLCSAYVHELRLTRTCSMLKAVNEVLI